MEIKNKPKKGNKNDIEIDIREQKYTKINMRMEFLKNPSKIWEPAANLMEKKEEMVYKAKDY